MTSPANQTCRVIEAGDGGATSAAIPEIHAGTLDSVIVKNVFPAEVVTEAARRVADEESELPVFQPPDGRKGLAYGWPLVAPGGSLPHYLDQAERFRAACAPLFGSDQEPERTLTNAITALAGDLEVSVPRADDGRPYLPATIRFLVAGDLLPLHYENEIFDAPGMQELAPHLDRTTLMSFYVPMVVSDRGGELRLYNATCLNGGATRIGELGGDDAARPHLEREGFEVLRPAAGDMLIFDGGRRYHEVTRIEGCTRWTMGGVLALSRDRRSIHFWS